MVITIILVVVAFVGGYLVGANNPLASVKQKIIDEANKIINQKN